MFGEFRKEGERTKDKDATATRRKTKGVVYKIQCKCEKAVYVGETWRQLKTRKKEHESKVRLAAANGRMGKEDRGQISEVQCRLFKWG